MPWSRKRGHGIARLRPGRARVATQVDHVGPLRAERSASSAQFLAFEPRGMVDLGQDLDVVLAVTGDVRLACLAEVARQVAEVLGARLDGETPCLSDDRSQIAPAVSGQDDAVDSRRGPRDGGRPTWASSARPPRSARRRPRP